MWKNWLDKLRILLVELAWPVLVWTPETRMLREMNMEHYDPNVELSDGNGASIGN